MGGRTRRSRAGFTLVELLVALVVLLIGVYGMLRIFPRGYSAIEVAQQRTVAAQLAESELARWKLHPESLPDAIVATDYEGNLIGATIAGRAETMQSLFVYGELAALMPGVTSYQSLTLPMGGVSVENLDFYAKALIYDPLDITPSQFDAAQAAKLASGPARPNTLHPNWEPNSLYLPRTVIGERIDIRRLGRTGLGVPFYLLSHAPLDPLRLEDDPNTPGEDRLLRVYVDVYDAQAWEYWPGGELGTRQFTVDVGSGTLSFGPTAEPQPELRQFKVDYTDPATFQRVLGTIVTVAGGTTQGSPSLPAGVDPDAVQVHERLQQVADPSLLLVTDGTARRNIFLVNPETTISGRIEFPLASQVDPRPTDIALVKVDYRVYDWGILAFDVEAPADGIVRLPVGRIKGPAYTNPPRQPRPQEVARGIKRYFDWEGIDDGRASTDPTTWAYVVAVDRQSGRVLTDHEGTEWPPNKHERRSRFLVSYQEAFLRFNFDPRDPNIYGYDPNVDTANRSGRTYRIFCRAESDWAVQLMVTARRFGRSATRVPGGQPVGGEGGGSTALLTYAWRSEAQLRRQVYFPLSEAGQAVAIDYYWQDRASGELVFVEGEVHKVGKPNVTDLGQWVCRLAEQLEHEPNDWGPLAVRGIGVRARAVWVSPGRAFTVQDLVWALTQSPPGRAVPSLSESWHQVVVDTYLMRAPI